MSTAGAAFRVWTTAHRAAFELSCATLPRRVASPTAFSRAESKVDPEVATLCVPVDHCVHLLRPADLAVPSSSPLAVIMPLRRPLYAQGIPSARCINFPAAFSTGRARRTLLRLRGPVRRVAHVLKRSMQDAFYAPSLYFSGGHPPYGASCLPAASSSEPHSQLAEGHAGRGGGCGRREATHVGRVIRRRAEVGRALAGGVSRVHGGATPRRRPTVRHHRLLLLTRHRRARLNPSGFRYARYLASVPAHRLPCSRRVNSALAANRARSQASCSAPS
ncbi:hypothetical protein B0H15DRAFT_119325 [Mycena belliarum]|uniref:Uncharacterized protein n=1 Tax=Mycena belliarum TaxID=1033014 RepID=A0AAD6XI39_9AGAR|nr:hypothetical protein B0H15DRAFT_119325 [Mycena belliae]